MIIGLRVYITKSVMATLIFVLFPLFGIPRCNGVCVLLQPPQMRSTNISAAPLPRRPKKNRIRKHCRVQREGHPAGGWPSRGNEVDKNRGDTRESPAHLTLVVADETGGQHAVDGEHHHVQRHAGVGGLGGLDGVGHVEADGGHVGCVLRLQGVGAA